MEVLENAKMRWQEKEKIKKEELPKEKSEEKLDQKDMEEHVIIQLEYEKERFLPVKTSWIVDFETLRPNIKEKSKEQSPTFFFYHKDPATKPSFSFSLYSTKFNDEKPACYKGYYSNKIFSEFDFHS